MDCFFTDDAEKLAFENKLGTLKQNHSLKITMDVFEHFLREVPPIQESNIFTEESPNSSQRKIDSILMCEKDQLFRLIAEVSEHSKNCPLEHFGETGLHQ